MRIFVIIVNIISIVASVILAIVAFIAVNVISGISLVFDAVYTAVFLAWVCSIDDNVDIERVYVRNDLSLKVNKLQQTLNKEIASHKETLRQVEELKVQMAYFQGQQAVKNEEQKQDL